MAEYWVNMYASGYRGLTHETRSDAEIAANTKLLVPTPKPVYRIHITMKDVTESPS